MELLELGKNPISESSPAGEDVRYEPEFEALENEIGKMTSLSATEGVDWSKVAKLCHEILSDKSKNLMAAIYLCVALLETEGLSGFASGVHVLRELLDNFWDTMFPPKKRMRGRKNAIAWWMEKVDKSIEGFETEKWPKEKHDTFLTDLEAIDTFLAENIEDAPVLRSFNERLTSLIEAIEPPPEPPPASEVQEAPAGEAAETPETTGEPAEATPAPAPAPARSEAEVSDADGETLLKQGLEFFGKAATVYMNQEQISPVPFRLNRIVAWIPVDNLPPATGEKTLIPPPDEQVITSLQNMYKSQNWNELLKAAESRVRQFLFWLDLSRYTAEALEQMKYPAISEAVGYETAAYVNRLSGIDKLTFADGTPFADEETREWLKSIAGKQGGADGTASSGGSDVEQQVAKELAEAQKKIKENKLSEALTGFSGKLNRASSVHERFIWILGLCRLLLRAKKPQLVLPYIKEILKMMDNYKIEQWEPKLAVDGFDLVLSGLRLQGENKDEELIENVLNRISALNPARALELL